MTAPAAPSRTIDGRCDCPRCEARTQKTYEMVGSCSNCGAGSLKIVYRRGDKTADQDCPVCGCDYEVRKHNQRAVVADKPC